MGAAISPTPPGLQPELLRGALKGAPVVVFDFETTGVEPGLRHPVQIALVTGRLGMDFDTPWSSLVKPPIPIPEEAAAIHGIRDEDVADAPTFADLVDQLLEHFQGRIPCAYNLPFDHAVLVESLDLLGRRPDAPAPLGLDPLVWAKVVDKYERGKRLEDVAGRRGLSFDAHDARADVDATTKVMPLLLRQLAMDGHVVKPTLDRVDAFWAWQRLTALLQERDYRDYRRRVGRDAPHMAWHESLGVGPDDPLD